MPNPEDAATENSIVIHAINDAIRKLDSDDFPEEIGFGTFLDLISAPTNVTSAWYANSVRWSNRRRAARGRQALNVQRHIRKRFGSAFHNLESEIASAEAVNCAMHDAFSTHLDDSKTEPYPPLLNIEGQPSEKTIWVITLVGLNARIVRLASEIKLLLTNGYHETARGLVRAMYETDAKARLIACHLGSAPTLLAGRYYVRGVYDAFERGLSEIDDENRKLFDAAISQWGDKCLTSQHNWATPAIPGNPKKVQLKDIVDTAGRKDIYHLYEEGNSALHTDSLTLIQSAGFERRQAHLFNMRGEVDLFQIGRAGHATAYLLFANSLELSYQVSIQCLDPDRALTCAALEANSAAAIKDFSELTERYEPRA
ncbi:DUF5677 domain-containing protein [Nocardia gipuzkoensis]